MKKFLVLVAFVAAFSVSSFAGDSSVVLAKLGEKSVFNGVTRYLGTSIEQERDLKYVLAESAKRYKDDSEKALRFNLANAKVILSPEQYRKYIVVLNMTVANNVEPNLIAEK